MTANFPQGIDIVRRINNDRGRAKGAVEKLVFVASKVEDKLVDHRSPFRIRHERRMSIGRVYGLVIWKGRRKEDYVDE